MVRACYRIPGVPAVLSLTVACWLGGAFAEAAERPAPDLPAGRRAYEQHCARCHGDLGKGDGLDAKRFYPRPRDLSLGIYKFRSTASGTPPSDDDLFDTITQGLPGSNMPDWQQLDEATRWQLVEYLKSLSPVFQQTPPAPVEIAKDPGAAKADAAKGQDAYEQLGCAACHGASGRANGPSAAGLMDDWGLPIRPADLTQGWSYRGGHSPKAVMLRVLTGIDGAGMPSYTGAVTPEDAWQLAYYVASLQQPPAWRHIVPVTTVRGELPGAADDARWASIERADVRLRNAVTSEGEWAGAPTVRAVAVQAAANEEEIALRVTWHDPSREPAEGAAAGGPSDALAVVLKPSGQEGDTVTLQAWPYQGAPALDLHLWSAATSEASEMIAADFTAGPGTTLPSDAHYEDGRWTVTLRRMLKPQEPEGAGLVHADGLTGIAFVVWDGSAPGTRAVSPWIELQL